MSAKYIKKKRNKTIKKKIFDIYINYAALSNCQYHLSNCLFSVHPISFIFFEEKPNFKNKKKIHIVFLLLRNYEN